MLPRCTSFPLLITASLVIRDTMDAEIIKLVDPLITLLRYRSYVPFWA